MPSRDRDQPGDGLVEAGRAGRELGRDLARRVPVVGAHEGRALERDREGRLERSVEDGVAGVVGEVGDQHRLGLLGRRVSAARPFWYSQRPPAASSAARTTAAAAGRSQRCDMVRWTDRRLDRLRVQVVQDLLDVLVAQPEVDGEAALDDLLEVDRKLGIQLPDGLGRALDPRDHDLERGGAAERNGPGGHLVQDHAEREDVGLRADGLALDLLGRHVERGPDDRARLGHSRLLG